MRNKIIRQFIETPFDTIYEKMALLLLANRLVKTDIEEDEMKVHINGRVFSDLANLMCTHGVDCASADENMREVLLELHESCAITLDDALNKALLGREENIDGYLILN